LRQREIIENTFGRYVDKKVAHDLMSRPEALKLGGEKRIVTIMMSDLRNFTPISEKLPPEVVIKMLNRYFARMIKIIEQYRGIIVDFYGDSILVFFDGLEADSTARACDAIRCALEMQGELQEFLRENEAKGLPPVNMGIGIHTGEVVVGNIGTESRAKYGIVGANVNLTDRIQATASAGKVIISEKTYELIYPKLKISLAFNACLKGVEEDKKLYEIEGITPTCMQSEAQ
jgi:adenylate cyclase